MNERGKIFIFSAPSGSGKTTIVQRVLASIPSLSFSVSATTRARRGKEADGIDYHFISVEEFQRRIKNKEFLEWEEVYSGRYYGTLLSEVERIVSAGKSAVFDLDVLGGINVKKHYGDEAVAFFVKPPSLQELRDRLVNRGTESEEEIERRLAKAEKELTYSPQFDYIIVNDDLETAVEETLEIIKKSLRLE